MNEFLKEKNVNRSKEHLKQFVKMHDTNAHEEP
jgi:hypothetical protein